MEKLELVLQMLKVEMDKMPKEILGKITDPFMAVKFKIALEFAEDMIEAGVTDIAWSLMEGEIDMEKDYDYLTLDIEEEKESAEEMVKDIMDAVFPTYDYTV